MAFDLPSRFANLTALTKSIVDAKQQEEALRQARTRDILNTVLGGAQLGADLYGGYKGRQSAEKIATEGNQNRLDVANIEAQWRSKDLADKEAQRQWEAGQYERNRQNALSIAGLHGTDGKKPAFDLQEIYQTGKALVASGQGWPQPPSLQGYLVPKQWSDNQKDQALAGFQDSIQRDLQSRNLSPEDYNRYFNMLTDMFKKEINYGQEGSGTPTPQKPDGEKPKTLGQKVNDWYEGLTGGAWKLPKFGGGAQAEKYGGTSTAPSDQQPIEGISGQSPVLTEKGPTMMEKPIYNKIQQLLSSASPGSAEAQQYQSYLNALDQPGYLGQTNPELYYKIRDLASKYSK